MPRELIVTNGVILAAGYSRRLQKLTGGLSKLLLPIDDKPLFLYPLSSLQANNIHKFCIVANTKNYAHLTYILNAVSDVDYNLVLNPKPKLGNGYSFLLSKKCFSDEPFVLSMGDHVYHPRIVKKLLSEFSDSVDIIVGGDSKPKFVDINEATKIYTKDDNVVRIGKRLKKYTHVDIGVFVFKPTIFELIEDNHFDTGFSLSDIINMAIRAGLTVKVVDIKGDYWTEVDTPRDYEQLIKGERRVVLENVKRYVRLTTKQMRLLKNFIKTMPLNLPSTISKSASTQS